MPDAVKNSRPRMVAVDSPESEEPEDAGAVTRVRTERLSVNLSQKTARDLRRVAAKRNSTITETIRRAVAALVLLEDEEDKGAEIQFVNARTREIRTVTLI